MSKSHLIRKQVRKMVEEIFDLSHFPFSYMGNNKFPYDTQSVINDEGLKDFFPIYNAFSKNQDVFDWPEGDFKKGMDVEKQKNPNLGIFDLAEIVVKNLKSDKKYYDKSFYV